jgi:hypothetical protein
MRAIQKRAGFTSDAIGQIESIKFSWLTPAVGERLQHLRRSEIADEKAFRRLQVSIIAHQRLLDLDFLSPEFAVYKVEMMNINL